MIRIVIITALIICVTSLIAKSQQLPVIGTASSLPVGSLNCSQVPLNPVVMGSGEELVTRCWNYQYLGAINLSYLIVSGLCGPFPLYNQLSFTIYDSLGTTLITSGTIVPIASNTFISNLVVGNWYVICYSWVANCFQSSACPLIYSSPLPIRLLYFNGYYSNNEVTLTWATESESNVDRYVVKRSTDGIVFENVGEVYSVGNSNTPTNYALRDISLPGSKLLYYKLLELSVDGETIIHSIIAINTRHFPSNVEYYDALGRKVPRLSKGVGFIKTGNNFTRVVIID